MMQLPQAVQQALEWLENAGYSAYVVGGAVRDALRGAKPHDFDVCTAASPAQIHQVFAGEHIIDTGIQHGTVTVILDGEPLEITAFRVEGGYSDGRHPDSVRFVQDLESDLARRDFTINAMAYSPTRGLQDPFGGQQDLQAGVLRAVGDPVRRFEEDALRILRGLRMAAENDFVLEKDTAKALRDRANILKRVAAERLSSELFRLLCGRHAGRVLRQYTDVLGVILPEILPMQGFEQKNRHHRFDVLEHSIRAVEQMPAEPALRFAALYHDTGKPHCMTIDDKGVGHFYGHPALSAALAEQRCLALKMSNELRETIVFIVDHHDMPMPNEAKIIRRRLARFGETRVRQLLMMKKADGVGRGTYPEYIGHYLELERMLNEVLRQKNCLSVRSLALDGHALLALGLRGRQIGDMQRYLLERVLDEPQCNTQETLTALVRQYQEEHT